MKWAGLPGLLLAAAACDNQAAERGGEVQEVANAAATKEVATERFLLKGRRYAVPSTHVSSIEREPPAFVRIKHPDARFDLVYDRRLEGARDPRGAPQIFSVNEGQAPNIEYHEAAGGVVVCRRASSPRGGCGMKVRHGGAEWSILFPYSRLQESEVIGRRAIALLNHYEA